MKKHYLLISSLIFTLSSCLTILQPLATTENIKTDNRIIGNWTDNESMKIEIQEFLNSPLKEIIFDSSHPKISERDSLFFIRHYSISYLQNGLQYLWVGGLVIINGKYYLELDPSGCTKGAEEAYEIKHRDYLSSMSIARLEWQNSNAIKIEFLNGDFIKENIIEGKMRIRHEYDPLFGTFLVTATSSEITQFLEKYGNNKELFNGGKTIVLSRKA
jgi:hypothetical protein